VPRTLLLVRHGLPDYRDRKRGDEPPGPPLSEIGRCQLRQTTRVLRGYAVQRVYSSPLARCQQSAEIIAGGLGLPLTIDNLLKEWHRTEDLFHVNERAACWLGNWCRGAASPEPASSEESCAVVVSHGSPILGILRAALYLPHFGWWEAGRAALPRLATADRFEVSMGSVFELVLRPTDVLACCRFHPQPRVMQLTRGSVMRSFPRPCGAGENACIRRPNWLRLSGVR